MTRASNSESEQTVSDEAYFLEYASKVSKMKAWQLANELANRVDSFDLLKDQSDMDPHGDTQAMNRTIRQIEVLTKECTKRKR